MQILIKIESETIEHRIGDEPINGVQVKWDYYTQKALLFSPASSYPDKVEIRLPENKVKDPSTGALLTLASVAYPVGNYFCHYENIRSYKNKLDLNRVTKLIPLNSDNLKLLISYYQSFLSDKDK